MFSDHCDISLHAEDREAARVTSLALDSGCEPRFFNDHGPFLELQFESRSGSSNNNSVDIGGTKPLPHQWPRLYGWLEQVPAGALTHFICDEGSTLPNGTRGGIGGSRSSSDAETSKTAVVWGQASFILHLWSTPHSSRAANVVTAAGGGGADTTSSSSGAVAMHPHEKAAADEGGYLQQGVGPQQRQQQRDGSQNAPPSLFDAYGRDVVLSDPLEREMELRDDTARVKSALNTIARVGAALQQKPNATATCLVVPDDTSVEYIRLQ